VERLQRALGAEWLLDRLNACELEPADNQDAEFGDEMRASALCGTVPGRGSAGCCLVRGRSRSIMIDTPM